MSPAAPEPNRNGSGRGADSPPAATKRRSSKEVVELADRYDIQVRTALRVDVAAEDAILREARRGAYDLIVLGVTRRPGDTLFFGNMAAAILESAYVSSVLFVAT
jgi:nucleotide-binding universal stress UspA family protein